MDKVSVVTPLYNKANMTGDYINSIMNYIDDNELILINNGSLDNTINVVGTAQKLFGQIKDITFISKGKNLGFGGGNNLGASLAKNDILLFLSNDVVLLGDFITPIKQYLEQNSRVAIGPRLIAWNAGWNSYKEDSAIPYLEGFCFAVRKEHFNMIGGFDEQFFLDMEDMDLCYRLRFAGIALAQIDLPVLHSLGGSFSTLNRSREDITLESQQKFMKKWGLHK